MTKVNIFKVFVSHFSDFFVITPQISRVFGSVMFRLKWNCLKYLFQILVRNIFISLDKTSDFWSLRRCPIRTKTELLEVVVSNFSELN